eukprot:1299853-Karenia_brevis.AAC.1
MGRVGEGPAEQGGHQRRGGRGGRQGIRNAKAYHIATNAAMHLFLVHKIYIVVALFAHDG